MRNILTLSLIAAASIQAAEPMVPGSMSTDRGGSKAAIDAYSDGGGVYMYDSKGRAAYDNAPMNNLVFKYGADAKDSGASLRDQVKTLSPSTADEKLLADKIPSSVAAVNPPEDGTVCNDFDPKTINDIFTAGTCAGTNVEGVACNDNNVQTINDKYVSGICIGTDTAFVSCKDVLDRGASTGDGVYTIDLDREGAAAPFRVYCDMTTDGGGWTLVAYNKGVSTGQVPSDFFAVEKNKTAVYNYNGITSGAASLNPENFSKTVNTADAMLKSTAYSTTPLIDKGFGKWTYDTPKCSGVLNHTSRTAGCTQSANDNYNTVDAFNIAIGNNGIVPAYLNSGRELCYSGKGWCNFEFFLR